MRALLKPESRPVAGRLFGYWSFPQARIFLHIVAGSNMQEYAKISVASYGKGSSAESNTRTVHQSKPSRAIDSKTVVDRRPRERTKKVGNTKKQKRINILKVTAVVAFFVIALGITGQQDADYANRPSVCREWQGSTVCYKP